jgi:hypothetical protein
VLAAVAQDDCHEIVPIGERVGFDRHELAGRTLDSKPAPVYRGREAFDDDAVPPFGRQRDTTIGGAS